MTGSAGDVPLVVVEGGSAAFDAACTALARSGWAVLSGWVAEDADRAGADRRTARAGRVATEREAAAAVLTALGGHGVVVDACGGRELTDRLCDDLRRVGPVTHRTGPAVPTLTGEVADVVDLLAGGMRLGQVAATLHLSRRTVDRRLAQARACYGVTSTPALLAAVTRQTV